MIRTSFEFTAVTYTHTYYIYLYYHVETHQLPVRAVDSAHLILT